MMPFQIAEQLKNSPHREQIDAEVDDYASNVLEGYHASIEASFIPALESALKGDLSFYADDQRCIPFLNYLCTQYMRTRGIKERVLALSPLMERIWNIAIHMSATNIGASLYLERKRRTLIIVNNRTDLPFITGDQPAINLKGTRPIPADRLSIFYPIAPHAGKTLDDLARMFNSHIRGWINYYGRYYKSALYPTLRHIDQILARWAHRKFKSLRRHKRRTHHWLANVIRRQPDLFVHWRLLYGRGRTMGAG